MRLSALGDVAMTIPQIYSVCQAYPDTTFVVLTQRVASSLFMYAPINLQVYIADVKARHKGLADAALDCKELSALGIDAVADLHDVLRTKILRRLFRMAGKTVSIIDKGRAEKKEAHSSAPQRITAIKTYGRTLRRRICRLIATLYPTIYVSISRWKRRCRTFLAYYST